MKAGVWGSAEMRVSSSGRRLDPDDQVRLPALGCEEGIDPSGLANQGDVGFHARCNGFQERHIRRAGQMPVLGIPDNEIEDAFVLRQNDDGGMPHLRLDIDELIDTGIASMRSIGPWAVQPPVGERLPMARAWPEPKRPSTRPTGFS